MHASWNAILKSDTSDRLTTFGVIMTTGHGDGAGRRAVPAGDRAGRVEISRLVGRDPRPLLRVPAEGLFLRRPQPHLSDRPRAGTAAGGAGVRPLHRRAPQGPGHRRRRAAELRTDRARHAAQVGRAAPGRPARACHAVRGADGHHHRGLHHRRWARRARRRADLRASPVLHRLALRGRRAVAAGAGGGTQAAYGVDASAQDLVARRDRRPDRQHGLRHRDLRTWCWDRWRMSRPCARPRCCSAP